ncbi:hypothetical protein TSAR_007244 [Trichomalopsis sarcophagae]|uniref:Uncharacterized protein n=1 Tax=Trichomalopsis sarcophagae TaxID=543379 RepID=A0A232EU12_9HYME|nr:hypothetical protein TSAR_007244 [Trichomalopsis sarcophagae]
MKTTLFLAALVAVAVAAPPASHDQHQVVLLKQQLHNNIGTGEGYEFSFEQDDGQKRQEYAEPIQVIAEDGSSQTAYRVRGSYSYQHPDTKQEYTVTYVADENGFVADYPKNLH